MSTVTQSKQEASKRVGVKVVDVGFWPANVDVQPIVRSPEFHHLRPPTLQDLQHIPDILRPNFRGRYLPRHHCCQIRVK